MRVKVLAVALAVLAVSGARAADQGADAAVGRWRTAQDGGVVEVSRCGDGLCGNIVTSERLKADPMQKDIRNKVPSLRERPIKGLAIFQNMAGGPTLWQGKIYNPIDGGMYAGSLQLTGADTLTLKGCLVWPLCRAQNWRRMK